MFATGASQPFPMRPKQEWSAEEIERHFKVHFHPEHVRKILKRRLKWTSQKPQKKAKERDEAAIDH